MSSHRISSVQQQVTVCDLKKLPAGSRRGPILVRRGFRSLFRQQWFPVCIYYCMVDYGCTISVGLQWYACLLSSRLFKGQKQPSHGCRLSCPISLCLLLSKPNVSKELMMLHCVIHRIYKCIAFSDAYRYQPHLFASHLPLLKRFWSKALQRASCCRDLSFTLTIEADFNKIGPHDLDASPCEALDGSRFWQKSQIAKVFGHYILWQNLLWELWDV